MFNKAPVRKGVTSLKGYSASFFLFCVVAFLSIAVVICLIGFTSGATWIMGPVFSAEAVEPN